MHAWIHQIAVHIPSGLSRFNPVLLISLVVGCKCERYGFAWWLSDGGSQSIVTTASILSSSASLDLAHFLLSDYRAVCALEAGGVVLSVITVGMGLRNASAFLVPSDICTAGIITLVGSLLLKYGQKSTGRYRLISCSEASAII